MQPRVNYGDVYVFQSDKYGASKQSVRSVGAISCSGAQLLFGLKNNKATLSLGGLTRERHTFTTIPIRGGRPGSPRPVVSFCNGCKSEREHVLRGLPSPRRRPDEQGGQPFTSGHSILLSRKRKLFTCFHDPSSDCNMTLTLKSALSGTQKVIKTITRLVD